MDKKLIILRNSFFLTVQPLLMNVISLFVMGYVARKLGRADFGIFNFVMTFTMLFFPVAMMGLNRISVRDVATLDNKKEYIGKMITTRCITGLIAILLIISIAHVMNYEKKTVHAIYMGCGVFLFQVYSEAFTDIFAALQRMEFTALVRMTAGLLLTLVSVVILFLGFGLFALIGVYAFGQMVGCVLAFLLIHKVFFSFRFELDFSFMKEKIKEGIPFFLMSLMWFAMMRLDTVALTKKVDMTVIGLYTSAILLVTRLSIIPQGIANSLLPAISNLSKAGEKGELKNVIQAFLTKLILFVLPGCIVISFFSFDIITFIFGKRFFEAGTFLRIGIWAFFIRCIAFVEFSILTAFHKEKQMVWSYFLGMCYCAMSNFILIRYFSAIGAVCAFVSTQLMLLIMITVFTFKTMGLPFSHREVAKIFVLNVILIFGLYIFKGSNVFIVAPVSLVCYLICALLLKLVTIEGLVSAKSFLVKVL